jgi:hypothetical protein
MLDRTLFTQYGVSRYPVKTVKVDEWFHEYPKTEKRDNETMGDALIRLTGAAGPDPDLAAGVIDEGDAEQMLEAIEHTDKSSAKAIQKKGR